MTLDDIKLKKKVFGLYVGQSCIIKPFSNDNMSSTDEFEQTYLLLRDISSLTVNEINHIARLAHQLPKTDFAVTWPERKVGHAGIREPFLVHATYDLKDIKMQYHISINAYGCINANWHFAKHGDDPAVSHVINIGKINMSARHPIPYLAITDYLREIGIATQAFGKSVKELIDLGIIKIAQ